jgi:hypothetical protein
LTSGKSKVKSWSHLSLVRLSSGYRVAETGAHTNIVVDFDGLARTVGLGRNDLFDGQGRAPRVLVRIQHDVVDFVFSIAGHLAAGNQCQDQEKRRLIVIGNHVQSIMRRGGNGKFGNKNGAARNETKKIIYILLFRFSLFPSLFPSQFAVSISNPIIHSLISSFIHF